MWAIISRAILLTGNVAARLGTILLQETQTSAQNVVSQSTIVTLVLIHHTVMTAKKVIA